MSTTLPRARGGEKGRERTRLCPVGAEVVAPAQTHFRVWAPKRQRVEVVLESPSDGSSTSPPPKQVVPLLPEGGGYFSGEAPVGAGALYRYRLDEGSTLYPDPASRFQ